VEPLVKDKRHVIVVPTGALTSLAFHLLLTETPAKPVLDVKDIPLYGEAPWLIKRQAVSVLPSVASLKTLRAFPRKADARKVMIAFADPKPWLVCPRRLTLPSLGRRLQPSTAADGLCSSKLALAWLQSSAPGRRVR
jgi:hypothetical protein